MNISDMRSFLNSSSPFNQSPQFGHRGQSAGSSSHIQPTVHSASYSPSTSGQLERSVFNNSLTDKLSSLGAGESSPVLSSQNSSGVFDFEEVAANVLSFVEKALVRAKSNGASNDKLNEMLGQARAGITEGFKQAREELGNVGLMNDSLSEGIDKSYDLIQEGLNGFDDSINGTQRPSRSGRVNQAAEAYSAEMSYGLSKESSLTIRTRDGDEVNISFSDVTRFQQSHQQAGYYASENNGDSTNQRYAHVQEDSTSFYRATGFSFSVDGELDDGEKEAIAELVQDISKLADDFFNGDLDKAFEKAQELGFDQSELSGFSLQMTRVEQVQIREAYGAYSQFGPPGGGLGGNTPAEEGPSIGQLLRPVDGYIKDFLEMLQSAQEQMSSGEDLHNLMNSTVNEYLKNQHPSLVDDGADRFNAFNQKIIDLLSPDSSTAPTESVDSTETTSTPTESPTS